MPKDKFNDEFTLLNNIRSDFESNPINIFPLTIQGDEITIAKQLLKMKHSDAWINSSGKNDLPPDFYSEKFKLMADIMQINDSERTKKRNIQREADSKLYDDLEQSGILDKFPNLQQIEILNPCQNIETNQHHRYSWYIKSFNRIVSKHKDSIELYRSNHPEYKLIFVIHDESEPYCQLPSCLIDTSKIKQGDVLQSEPHYPFLDRNIMQTFIDSDIDYVVWYMNNKDYNYLDDDGLSTRTSFRKIIVFSPNALNKTEFKDYYNCRMFPVNL